MDELSYNKLSSKIINACIEVHRELGPGLLESVYEECLTHELRSRGLYVERQVEIPVMYKGKETSKTFFMDLLVEDLIVVELKAVDNLLPIHEVQTVTYMRLADKKLGLLINFNVTQMRQGIRRKINGNLNE
ncbi:GxxExxY protein [Spirosoma sp. HMF3257]|uniref:GxxExxY protein n=1 Tax=Spirosoma telluris TaxID=2183553 RepID=A0A327NIW5_9BACT|nr:GxxExxY protein [Spirosoma telluris]RAI75280.1 GxxExxY protein [Spirosoma telluris]